MENIIPAILARDIALKFAPDKRGKHSVLFPKTKKETKKKIFLSFNHGRRHVQTSISRALEVPEVGDCGAPGLLLLLLHWNCYREEQEHLPGEDVPRGGCQRCSSRRQNKKDRATFQGSVLFGNGTVFSDEVCDSLTDVANMEEERYVEYQVARLGYISAALQATPAIIMALFAGAW